MKNTCKVCGTKVESNPCDVCGAGSMTWAEKRESVKRIFCGDAPDRKLSDPKRV